MIFRCFLILLIATVASTCAAADNFQVPGIAGSEKPIFYYRKPSGISTGVLLLVPGYNGSGQSMLDERWCRFADEHGLVLLAPTFQTTPEQLKKEKGYYYPEQGSGAQVEMALAEARRKTGVRTDQILIFGFSAGAHFAHRFALWKPGRVAAFVAYSAAWWSEPQPTLRSVPALIMCGETDERYEATRAFMEKALALHLPWVWRSYKNTGHQLTPSVRSMAEVFLAYYANRMNGNGTPQPNSGGEIFYGDIQSYRVVPGAERDSILEEVRIVLPSQAIADTWIKEN